MTRRLIAWTTNVLLPLGLIAGGVGIVLLATDEEDRVASPDVVSVRF